MSESLQKAYAVSTENGLIAAIKASESADFVMAMSLLMMAYDRGDIVLVLACVAQSLQIAANVSCDELADEYEMLAISGPREHSDGSSVAQDVNRTLMILTGIWIVALAHHEKTKVHARKTGNPLLGVACSKGGENKIIADQYASMVTDEVRTMYNDALSNFELRAFLTAAYKRIFPEQVKKLSGVQINTGPLPESNDGKAGAGAVKGVKLTKTNNFGSPKHGLIKAAVEADDGSSEGENSS